MSAAGTQAHAVAPLPRRRVNDELGWFFGYAEAALRHQRVALLPSYAAERARARDAARKATRLAIAVRECLTALPNPHAVVLRAVFTPRRWPRVVHQTFKDLAPVVVRLFCTQEPWPGRVSHQGLEEAAALQLAARLASNPEQPLERLRAEAERLLEAAVDAYAAQRRA